MLLRILLQILLLVASAFFSGSETALFSLSRLDMQQLMRQRNPHFASLQSLLERPRQLIISILCGNEIINVAAAANMTGILVTLYGVELGGLLTVLVMVPLLLLFGEVTPKTIAVSDPVRVSTRIIAGPLNWWVKLIAPFRWLVRLVSDRLTGWVVGEEPAPENLLQVDEFRSLVDGVTQGGELSARERSLIYNLLDAGTTEVVEIMIPRSRAVFIDLATPMTELVSVVRTLRHMRLPVYRGSRDNLVGFLHAEDILQRVLSDSDFSTMQLENLLHPPLLVPPTKTVSEMLDFFLVNNAQAAAVVNEFGGIDGLITLKRVLGYVFGPLTPESTLTVPYRQLAENVFEVPGDMKLVHFNDLTNFALDDPRMTTIGCVVLWHWGRLPEVGDRVVIEGVELTVIAMEGTCIETLQASKGGPLGRAMTAAAQESGADY